MSCALTIRCRLACRLYLTNAAKATRVQDLIDRDIFPLDVAGLPASCNPTVTIVKERIGRVYTHVRVISALYQAAICVAGERDRDAIITIQHSNRSTFVH